jgi:hypothetical protein
LRYAVGTVAGVVAVLPAVATSYRNNLQYIYIYYTHNDTYIYTYIMIYTYMGWNNKAIITYIYSVQSINMKGAEESSKLCKLESFRFN